MRAFQAVILVLLFVWNSVAGETGALVLCVHSGGNAHIELRGKATSDTEQNCSGSEASVACVDECPPCTDLVLQSVDLEPGRPNEFGTVSVPVPLGLESSGSHLEVRNEPRRSVAIPHPTRGPPAIEPVCEMISRVVVLRL